MANSGNPSIDPIAQRDRGVDFIAAQLDALQPIGFAPAMFRALNAVRVLSLQPGRRNLLERQKHKLIGAMDRAYRAIYPSLDEHDRFGLTWAVNAAATLVLIWRGDDPKWTKGSSSEADARDLVLSYELELLSTICLEAVAARNTAGRQKREEIIANLLKVPPEGEPILGESP